MLSLGNPKENLCKLIFDAASKSNISVKNIQTGLNKFVLGISNTDYEKYAMKVQPQYPNIDVSTKDSFHDDNSENNKEEPNKLKECNSQLIIHVFDETRKDQKDFVCPRNILLNEMKYFKTFLNNSSAQSEEVDIAVHCDLDIFNWLMNYAKQPIKTENFVSSFLESSNWTSVLISANFLQMDDLVEDCILFCKNRINDIIHSPSNFQCIDDNLITRISNHFNPAELDNISDPKDKIKSKLYAIKISQLFDTTTSTKIFFRCAACKALITNVGAVHVACIPSRTTVSRDGHALHAKHILDKNFKVEDFILNLKKNRTWCEVYWILWSCINHLTCSRCGQIFMCHNVTSCVYHSEMPKFENDDFRIVTFPCCNLKVNNFDPLQVMLKTGCKVRDHVVNVSDETTDCNQNSPANQNEAIVYQELMAHKDIISSYSDKYGNVSSRGLELFGIDESLKVQTKKSIQSIWGDHDQNLNKSVAFDDIDEDSLGSDGNSADEEQFTKFKEKKIKSGKDAEASRRTHKDVKWDVNKSLRYNQDAQRQEDQKRMNELSKYLFSLRFNQEDAKKYKHKTFAGGIFSMLETQWKATHTLNMKSNQGASSRSKVIKNNHVK